MNDRLDLIEKQVRALVANAQRGDVPRRELKREPTYSVILSGYTEIVGDGTVTNAGGALTGWATFDASSLVPYDAALVVVTGIFEAGAGHTTVKLRRDELGKVYNLCATANNSHGSGTCIIPIVRSYEKRTFDYNIESSSSAINNLEILGYYKISKVSGTGFLDAESSDGTSSSGGRDSGSGTGIE